MFLADNMSTFMAKCLQVIAQEVSFSLVVCLVLDVFIAYVTSSTRSIWSCKSDGIILNAENITQFSNNGCRQIFPKFSVSPLNVRKHQRLSKIPRKGEI